MKSIQTKGTNIRFITAFLLLLMPRLSPAQDVKIPVQPEEQQQQHVEPQPAPSENPFQSSQSESSSSLSSYEQGVRKCPCLFDTNHVLAGHAFLPVLEQPAAFADSRTTLSLGVGQGTYNETVGGVGTNVDLIAMAPTLAVQVTIIPHLALFGSFSSVITTGLNSQSALIYGGSVRYAWSFGGLYELLRSQDSVLSIALQINKPHTLAVSPIQSVVQSVETALSGLAPDVVNSSVSTEYRPNLRFAHGFNSSLGVQLNLGGVLRSTTQNNTSSSGTLFTAAVGLSSDLNPAISVPVGFTLTFSRNQIISRSESNVNLATVGIWETVTHRFNSGVEVGWLRRSGLDSTIGSVLMRTYFN